MISTLVNLVIGILIVGISYKVLQSAKAIHGEAVKNYELALDLHERDIRSTFEGDTNSFVGPLSKALEESDNPCEKE